MEGRRLPQPALGMTANLTAKPKDFSISSRMLADNGYGKARLDGLPWMSVDRSPQTFNPSVLGSNPSRPISLQSPIGVSLGFLATCIMIVASRDCRHFAAIASSVVRLAGPARAPVSTS